MIIVWAIAIYSRCRRSSRRVGIAHQAVAETMIMAIKNGLLLICELKSSIDKAGMYIFERKARFYERRHERKADRLLVISPMIDARARKVAEQLGIEMYSDSDEVETL